MREIGGARLYLGDCLEVMTTLPDSSVDMVLTSPPYDNLRSYNDGPAWTWEVFTGVAEQIARLLVSGGVCVWNVADATVNGSETGTSFRQALHFMDVCGLRLHDTMIYHKASQPKQNGYRYEQHFEYMFVFTKGAWLKRPLLREPSINAGRAVKRTSRDNGQETLKSSSGIVSDMKVRGNVWFYGTKTANTGHPAVFPLQLAEDHIRSWAEEEATVLDPFLGSGTTAIAASMHGRKCIGIERDPTYYEIACKRVTDASS